MQAFKDLVAVHGGEIAYDADALAVEQNPTSMLPLYEYTWNHTTLHAMKVDKSFTYLQSVLTGGRDMELITHLVETFGEEVPMHIEMIRFGGKPTTCALQLVRFTSEERLNEIIAYHEDHGVLIANPHVWTLEDGAAGKADPAVQRAFKQDADPFGLLNPGKMRSFSPAAS
ncbi:MAG: hypothetical protein JJ899_15695 [Alphaproteobacteria bacterium]|nr:hypothetical protein [Alphaproteobacteria bacterium]